MRFYRFILEMQNGKCFRVRAMSQHEAEVLTEAYCILMALAYDLDVVTCEEHKLATRYCVDPQQFEQEWDNAEQVEVTIRQR